MSYIEHIISEVHRTATAVEARKKKNENESNYQKGMRLLKQSEYYSNIPGYQHVSSHLLFEGIRYLQKSSVE